VDARRGASAISPLPLLQPISPQLDCIQTILDLLQFSARIPDEILNTPSMHFIRRKAELSPILRRHVLICGRAIFKG
jgi:hypothetical protein